nr:MAG TPA: hypothetical protein [Bacteriophage sp.]
MRCFVVVDLRKIQKTVENRAPETPWKGVPPQEYLLPKNICKIFCDLIINLLFLCVCVCIITSD